MRKIFKNLFILGLIGLSSFACACSKQIETISDYDRTFKGTDIESLKMDTQISSIEAADPYVTYDRYTDYYYSLCTRGTQINIWRSRHLTNLFDSQETITIYVADPQKDKIKNSLWAPEMHLINDRWYIYTSSLTTMDSLKHLTIFESESRDPFDGFHFKCFPNPETYAIDPTYTEWKGQRYLCYSEVINGLQVLKIRPLENKEPWKFKGNEEIDVSWPTDYWWEYSGSAINEGPFFIQRNNTLFLTFSGSGCNDDDYSLGYLKLNGSNVMDKESWEKNPQQILYKNPEGNMYATGHASFFYSPDKTELWCAYHSHHEPDPKKIYLPRYCHVQKVTFIANTPFLGPASPLGTKIMPPSGEYIFEK